MATDGGCLRTDSGTVCSSRCFKKSCCSEDDVWGDYCAEHHVITFCWIFFGNCLEGLGNFFPKISKKSASPALHRPILCSP